MALAGAGVLLLAACGGSGDDAAVVDAAGTIPEWLLDGADGFRQQAPVDPGTYELESLGIPVTVTLEGDWWVRPNELGHTVFSHPNSARPGDRDVVFLRPTSLADPTQPGPAERQNPRRSGGSAAVREGGLEPPRPCGHQHLKLARLPFRHSRNVDSAG